MYGESWMLHTGTVLDVKVILLFVDGIGLGDHADYNPFVQYRFPFIEDILQGRKLTKHLGAYRNSDVFLIPTDATLGVSGIPQSATGQAAIFTGRNAPEYIGSHQSGFPFKRLREWIEPDTIYQKLQRLDRTATFSNAYSQEYFESKTAQRGWMSVSTISMLAAGLDVRMLDDLKAGRAVYHDLTRRSLQERYKDVSTIMPETAARHLLDIASDHDLTVHEYFLTDLFGHRKDTERFRDCMLEYDRFLAALYREKSSDTTLVLCSDHGNAEDMRKKIHTFHHVPTLILGEGGERIAERIQSLVDIAPSIVTLFQAAESREKGVGMNEGNFSGRGRLS